MPNYLSRKRVNSMVRDEVYYQNRINLLTNRDPVVNVRLINKLKRQLRALKANG